jgi:hypothetical protein
VSDHVDLARRFYQQQVLEVLVGRKVRFKVDVDRVDFTVRKGATGIMQPPFLHDGRLVAAVLLNRPPAAAHDYDNEVHWIEDENLIDFEDEVELAE